MSTSVLTYEPLKKPTEPFDLEIGILNLAPSNVRCFHTKQNCICVFSFSAMDIVIWDFMSVGASVKQLRNSIVFQEKFIRFVYSAVPNKCIYLNNRTYQNFFKD